MRFERFHKTFVPASLGVAVLIALTAPVHAQDGKTEKPAAERPAPASSTTSASADSNSLTVAGLTKENSATTKTALEGLTHSSWRCPECDMTSTAKGTCEMCKKDLVSEKSPSLRSIVVDADKGTIGFALAPGQSVRLTQIEAALTPQKITVPREKLTLSPTSTLMVSGVASEESAKKLETELKNAKLFDTISCRVTSDKQGEVKVHCTQPAARTKVEEAIAKAGPEFKLVDIIWTAPAGKSG